METMKLIKDPPPRASKVCRRVGVEKKGEAAGGAPTNPNQTHPSAPTHPRHKAVALYVIPNAGRPTLLCDSLVNLCQLSPSTEPRRETKQLKQQ